MATFGYIVPVNFFNLTASPSFVIELHPVQDLLAASKIATRSIGYDNNARDSFIVLTNGSIYDPYQEYDSPIILGKITGQFNILPGGGLSDQQIASAIDDYFESLYAALGRRGTLRGIPQRPSPGLAGLDCEVRMLSLSTTAGSPHDTYSEGPINRAPAFSVTWQQLTEWEPI